MAEHAFLGHGTPLQQSENDKAPLQRRYSSTCDYDDRAYPSSSSCWSSSSLSAAVQPGSMPSSSSPSWQEHAGSLSSSQQHAAEAYHMQNQHHQNHHRHRERYEYLQLIDELRTCGKLKAEIVGHPLFENLLQAHVQCLSVGVPSLQLPDLEAQLARKESVVLKYVTFGNEERPCPRDGSPAERLRRTREIDAFMENYLQLLVLWKKRFLPPTMDALSTLSQMEQSFRDLTGASFNLQEAAATLDSTRTEEEMEDLSCVDGVLDMDFSKCDIDQALLEHVRIELKHKLKESYKENIMAMHEEILRKRQAGKLPGDVTALKRWWDSHSKWPYPTELEKRKLVEETGLEMRQINNWFINHRKRNWIDRGPSASATSTTGLASQREK